MTGNDVKNDRVGCLRTTIGARPKVCYPPLSRAEEVMTKLARGCGNAAPMEIKNRFPQERGNLAQNARFPHSHKPIPLYFK